MRKDKIGVYLLIAVLLGSSLMFIPRPQNKVKVTIDMGIYGKFSREIEIEKEIPLYILMNRITNFEQTNITCINSICDGVGKWYVLINGEKSSWNNTVKGGDQVYIFYK